MAYTLKHRRLQLTKVAMANRPVRITYQAENPCPGIEGMDRVIEIRRIYSTKDGNDIVRAWCRMCAKEESFHMDRIIAHRVLRGAPADTNKPVTAYLTAQRGRVPAADLAAVYIPQPTCDGLLAAARQRIDAAARFRAVFGDPAAYPRRARPLTADDLIRQARESIRVAATFRQMTADLTPELAEAHA